MILLTYIYSWNLNKYCVFNKKWKGISNYIKCHTFNFLHIRSCNHKYLYKNIFYNIINRLQYFPFCLFLFFSILNFFLAFFRKNITELLLFFHHSACTLPHVCFFRSRIIWENQMMDLASHHFFQAQVKVIWRCGPFHQIIHMTIYKYQCGFFFFVNWILLSGSKPKRAKPNKIKKEGPKKRAKLNITNYGP